VIEVKVREVGKYHRVLVVHTQPGGKPRVVFFEDNQGLEVAKRRALELKTIYGS
jgi:hypothetical protein